MTSNYLCPPAANRSTASVKPLFVWVSTVATPAVLDHFEAHGVHPHSILNRHRRCDWGELCEEDVLANNHALRSGARLLSAYSVAGTRIWVITEAVNDVGIRASTCILFPEEY